MLGITGLVKFALSNKSDSILIVSTLFVTLYSIWGVLKQLRNPWQGELTLGLFILGAIWLGFYIVRLAKNDQVPKLNSKNVTFIVGAILITAGAIFKIQRLPGANVLMLMGLTVAFIYFLIGFLNKKE